MKPEKRTAVYAVTYHELFDKLGIDARKIIAAEVRLERKMIDDVALILTVEEEISDE